jgi:hypothetical protein
MEQGTATAIAEADEAAGSTPDQAADSPEAQAQDTPAASAATETARARTGSEAKERDAAAWKRLEQGESAESIRQNPKRPADPSANAKPAKPKSQQQGKTETTAEAETTNDEDAGNDADSDADGDPYAGADSKDLSALRRAKLLPDADTWKTMPVSTRKALAASARSVLQARGKMSQQLGQQRQQQQAGQQQADDTDQNFDEDLAPTGEEEDAAVDEETDGTIEPPQPRPQRGVRAQTQQPAARPGKASPTPASLDDVVKPLADLIGPEAVEPVKAFLASQQRALAQQRQENQKLATFQQQQLQGMAEQIFKPQEREAFKELAKDAGNPLPPQRQEEVLANAVHFFGASANGNEPITWKEAVMRAGRSILSPDIQQQAQAKLLERRNQSLKNSPARGTGPTRPHRARSPQERDSEAWRLLEAGHSATEVRAALS